MQSCTRTSHTILSLTRKTKCDSHSRSHATHHSGIASTHHRATTQSTSLLSLEFVFILFLLGWFIVVVVLINVETEKAQTTSIWNHLLLEMFKFHILDLLLRFSFVKTLFIYWCNWLIIEILFTFVFNLIWLYCIFIKIEILLKPDPRGPRGGGGPIYLVRVRSGTDWPGPLPMRVNLMRGGPTFLPTPNSKQSLRKFNALFS